MDVSDKYNIKFLDLKSIPACKVKIIHVLNKNIENIRNLLLFEEQESFAETVFLHYVGEKSPGRARLARCRKPDDCALCLHQPSIHSTINPRSFHKTFFYGIYDDELVYFSLNKANGLQVVNAIKSCSDNALDLNNEIVCSFVQKSDRNGFIQSEFQGLAVKKRFKVNPEILEQIKTIPTIRSLVNEKYPLSWNEEIKEALKK